VAFGVSLLPILIGFSPGTGVTLMPPGTGILMGVSLLPILIGFSPGTAVTLMALGEVTFAGNLLPSPGAGLYFVVPRGKVPL
jgi:hypothetical protein